MNVVLVGWYGTETIGDRAILAGVLSFFAEVLPQAKFKLGSLYPFYSERTLSEDSTLWRDVIGRSIELSLFNSKSISELRSAISWADIVVVAGGPLMDIDEMFMVEYAFKRARQKNKKTVVCGCGIGPFKGEKYIASLREIVSNSDLILVRDCLSGLNLKKFMSQWGFLQPQVYSAIDPAVACLLKWSSLVPGLPGSGDYICLNLRRFPQNYCDSCVDADPLLHDYVARLAAQNPRTQIRLVPMHYFHSGDDDRMYLNELALRVNKENIFVQNVPLTLAETMDVYRSAIYNVGMRFHAIVFQTILSGINYVIDYTNPETGKTIGFIKDIDTNAFYAKRYINLQQQPVAIEFQNVQPPRFSFDNERIQKTLNVYSRELRALASQV